MTGDRDVGAGPDPGAVPGLAAGTAVDRETLRAEALRLGFASCGFAPAAPPPHADVFRAWLAEGRHGAMAWLAREDAVRRRLDPREALPGCRSLVVVAWNCAPPGAAPLPPDRGAIAAYARGRDYHARLEERLRRLVDWIEDRAPGAACRPYVDHGPVLERDHAQRAGLGWIGKNAMLIDPRGGSHLLLGALLTTLELEPDPPFEPDRCGTCARCLEACPTGAIVAPRVVDARLCISYLTIELRGPIPRELRPAIGNRVFGCDICQDVCPFNLRFAEPAADPAFAARGPGQAPAGVRPEGARTAPGAGGESEETRGGGAGHPGTRAPRLVDLLETALDGAAWDAFSRGSAIRRAGRAGFARNVCVALGNWGSPEAVPALRSALSDPEPLVRAHAAWALGRVGTAEAGEALAARLPLEADDHVRAEIEAGCGRA